MHSITRLRSTPRLPAQTRPFGAARHQKRNLRYLFSGSTQPNGSWEDLTPRTQLSLRACDIQPTEYAGQVLRALSRTAMLHSSLGLHSGLRLYLGCLITCDFRAYSGKQWNVCPPCRLSRMVSLNTTTFKLSSLRQYRRCPQRCGVAINERATSIQHSQRYCLCSAISLSRCIPSKPKSRLHKQTIATAGSKYNRPDIISRVLTTRRNGLQQRRQCHDLGQRTKEEHLPRLQDRSSAWCSTSPWLYLPASYLPHPKGQHPRCHSARHPTSRPSRWCEAYSA